MRTLSITEAAVFSNAGLCYTPPVCAPPPPVYAPTPPACESAKVKHVNNGFGNGANDGVPGKSSKIDAAR